MFIYEYKILIKKPKKLGTLAYGICIKKSYN